MNEINKIFFCIRRPYNKMTQNEIRRTSVGEVVQKMNRWFNDVTLWNGVLYIFSNSNRKSENMSKCIPCLIWYTCNCIYVERKLMVTVKRKKNYLLQKIKICVKIYSELFWPCSVLFSMDEHCHFREMWW